MSLNSSSRFLCIAVSIPLAGVSTIACIIALGVLLYYNMWHTFIYHLVFYMFMTHTVFSLNTIVCPLHVVCRTHNNFVFEHKITATLVKSIYSCSFIMYTHDESLYINIITNYSLKLVYNVISYSGPGIL